MPGKKTADLALDLLRGEAPKVKTPPKLRSAAIDEPIKGYTEGWVMLKDPLSDEIVWRDGQYRDDLINFLRAEGKWFKYDRLFVEKKLAAAKITEELHELCASLSYLDEERKRNL
jgi:hypothetical protein